MTETQDIAATTTPALPPGLAELNSVPRDVFLKQMESHPLFMQSLPTDSTGSTEFEALQALAYEGTPQEIALNFKEQGNEAYREKRYRDALEFYSKGLAAKCGEWDIEGVLYLNRAAVNLELRTSLSGHVVCVEGCRDQSVLMVENYGDVLRDCGKVLMKEEKNVKALYRSAKACLALDKVEEADDAISRAMESDPANGSFRYLKADISKRKGIVNARTKEEEAILARRRDEDRALKMALKIREITISTTPHPPDLGPIEPYHLTDPINPNSDLNFPTILLYPLTSQTDLISAFPISASLYDQLSAVLEVPPEWDTEKEYTPDSVECYMETAKGGGKMGLIKVGKRAELGKALKGRTLMDGLVRINVVPRAKASIWLSQIK